MPVIDVCHFLLLDSEKGGREKEREGREREREMFVLFFVLLKINVSLTRNLDFKAELLLK